jgi:SET domain-containing protein
MMLPILFIAPSPKGGRGVFAAQKIAKDTIIEISPVLVFGKKQRAIVEKTNLYNYIFEWGKSGKKAALGMGYLSMYNHDYNANCEYGMDFDNQTMQIKTIRAIRKHEELCINYNAIPTDNRKIWFDAK